MTRPSLIIILAFIFSTTFAFGQKGMDTTISKLSLDSIKTESNRLKLYNKKLFYKNRLLLSLTSVDTTYPKQDSIVISYKLHDTLLQRIIKEYKSPDCQSYETIEYFNEKGFPEFVEYWTCDCRTQKDVADDEIIFEKILLHYERFLYDKNGRILLRTFWYSSIGARKIEYSYSKNGQVSTKVTKILENEFWN